MYGAGTRLAFVLTQAQGVLSPASAQDVDGHWDVKSLGWKGQLFGSMRRLLHAVDASFVRCPSSRASEFLGWFGGYAFVAFIFGHPWR